MFINQPGGADVDGEEADRPARLEEGQRLQGLGVGHLGVVERGQHLRLYRFPQNLSNPIAPTLPRRRPLPPS